MDTPFPGRGSAAPLNTGVTPMSVSTRARALLLSLCLLPLAACTNPSDSTEKSLANGLDKAATEVRAASDKVREKIATGDIDLSSKDAKAPKAVITAQGELVIGGHTVPANPAQHALLLEYRGQIEQIAQAGADIGLQGAGVAISAAGEALKGVFSGASEADIKRSVEAQANGIKEQAAKLCDRLPAFIATQDQLAAALPEFAPYANADTDDIANCRADIDGVSITKD